MRTDCQLADKGETKRLHSMPADPADHSACLLRREPQWRRCTDCTDPDSTSLCLSPGGIHSPLNPSPALSRCKTVSALVPSFPAPSPALFFVQAPAELSPGNRSSIGSSRLSSRGAEKYAVLADSASEALCYCSPCPAALMGISSRSLIPTQASCQDPRWMG